jgi:hypothetical protein
MRRHPPREGRSVALFELSLQRACCEDRGSTAARRVRLDRPSSVGRSLDDGAARDIATEPPSTPSWTRRTRSNGCAATERLRSAPAHPLGVARRPGPVSAVEDLAAHASRLVSSGSAAR